MSQPLNTLPDNYFGEITRLLDELDARPRPTHSPRGLAHRGTLGDFTSVVCFQAAVRGLEDVLGPGGAGVVLIRAGRLRGQALVDDWGVGHLDLPIEKIGLLLDAALGHGGTRLCAVRGITASPKDIRVNIQETICDAGQPSGQERHCSYTLGAVWGALETLTGQHFKDAHVIHGGAGEQFVFIREQLPDTRDAD